MVNKRTGKKSDWTVDEAIKAFQERYFNDHEGLTRAQQIRQEDHKMLTQLKAKNILLERMVRNNATSAVINDKDVENLADALIEQQNIIVQQPSSSSSSNTAVIVLTSVSLLVLVVVLIFTALKFKKQNIQ